MSEAAHDRRSLVAAFRLLFGASMLSMLFGVGTNKLIAMLAGAEGVALIGIYRNLTSFVVGVLSLGLSNVVVQKISTADSDEGARAVIRGAWRLFVLQALAISLAAATLPGVLSRWLAGDRAHTTDFRLALLMIIGVLGMQVVVDVLNGRALVRDVTAVNVSTSALTMLSVYPLLRIGRVGLAMIIGLTCFWGAALGAALIRSRYRIRWADLRIRFKLTELTQLPMSVDSTIRNIAWAGALLAVQAIVNRHYSTSALGLYNAAALLESVSMLLLMSGMRSYYLPKLGTLADQDAKNALLNDVLRLLLVLLFPALPALVLAAPWVLWILFARSFQQASGLIAVFSFAMIAETFLWCLGFFVLHKAAYRLSMVLDTGWSLLVIALVAGCAVLGLPLAAVAWSYAIGMAALLVGYVVAARARFHRDIISGANAMRGVALTAWTTLCYVAAQHGRAVKLGLAAATVAISAALVAAEMRHARARRTSVI